jgi:hypothetical protein
MTFEQILQLKSILHYNITSPLLTQQRKQMFIFVSEKFAEITVSWNLILVSTVPVSVS